MDTQTNSIEDLAERFLADQKTKFSQATYEARVTNLKKFKAFLKERGLSRPVDLNPQLIWEYERVRLQYFRLKKPGDSVCQGALKQDTASLRIFLGYLYDEQALLSDLGTVLNKVPTPKSLPRPLSLTTIKEWFHLCDLENPRGVRDRAIFELIYGSGLRSGEAMSLTVGDLDLAERQVIIRQTKTRRSRIVPMTRLSVRFLNRYLTKVRPWLPRSPETEHCLWLSAYGPAMTGKKIQYRVRTKYRPRVQSAFPISLHALRHSFATHLLKSGASVRHVQEILGHHSVNSTQIYTQVAIKDLKEVHRRFHPRGS